jgi:hypothetical protein
MKARVKFAGKLVLIAVVGFLIVVPWTVAWVYLFPRAVVPYVQSHFACCSIPRSDPEEAIFSIYAAFDAAIAVAFALVSSLTLGALVRPQWLLPWLVLCASTAIGLSAAAHTKVFESGGLIFIIPSVALYAYAVAAGLGFWIARVWRPAPIPSN